jgi:type II secretory pathway pseudopilin PulG
MLDTARPLRPRTDAGFTLVEALVAIVILVFGLIAITNLMLVAASSNSVANQSTAAASIATQTLEELKMRPFGDPLLQAGGSLTSDQAAGGTNYYGDSMIDGVGTIHTRWQIVDVDTAVPPVKFIAVRSEGTGVLSRGRSRAEFTTFRVRNP